jgi:hypothetical protein
LALGIGATAAVFCLIQGVLLALLPNKHSEKLVHISGARTDGQPMAGVPSWPAQQCMKQAGWGRGGAIEAGGYAGSGAE